jgi:PAS domain S-box-containing protein
MDLESRDDLVTAGLTEEDIEFLWNNRMPGQVWHERFGPEFERFKIGEFFHLPWSDPWVRKRFSEGTVPSNLPQEEMVDWDPQDLLYTPLRLADGRIVGILSIDDPIDGRRPTKESLAPFELFIHQAAVAIENAQLFEQLEKAKNQVKEYAKQLEEKVKERTIDLRRSEEKLRSIITASPSAVTATDISGNIIECNEQTLRMHGYSSKEELIGKSAFELIAERDHQKALESMRETVKEGLLRNIEYTFVTKGGREFPAELSVSVVRDASDSPIGFVAITSDITERKRLE